MLMFRQGVEKWSQATSLATAALLDVYPILRSLPDICVPIRPYAKALHIREQKLNQGHLMNVKSAIKNGSVKVSLTLSTTLSTTPSEPLFTSPASL